MACDAHSNTRVVVSHTPKGQSTREKVKKKTSSLQCTGMGSSFLFQLCLGAGTFPSLSEIL